ncbi:MAG: TIGR03564 family F420-dependent LLM class oxidoreductase [Chloroflexota bacterium]|nr:TIGR03564 family F420-dependent LLM class oxidoreductase [Chloroflexota bacterium]
MRIGLTTSDAAGPAATLDAQVHEIVACEQDGFESAWLNHVFGADALTLISLAGARTSRIELGTAVVPVYTQHPFALAQQAATTQAATGGRLTLGIGLSHKPVVENMWGLSYEHPARQMREYLSVLAPLLREGRVARAGELYRVAAGLQIPGTSPVPVLVAALAPAMLRIAAELADGTVTWMAGVKTVETHVVPRINAAAEAAGRARPRVCVGLPVAVTDDAAAARAKAAKTYQIYGQLPNYRRMLDIEGAGSPGDVALVGDEAAVERQVRALASAGATDFSAVIFPAGEDARASVARTRALLRGLVGRV